MRPGTVPAWQHEPVAEAERTIVIIEDDPNIADLLDMYLRDSGFRVLQAGAGERGLELIEQHRPALVVLDIGLPDIDGFEVLARLRADEATRALPVVAVTAQAMPEDVKRVLAAGFDGYLAKPLDLARFDALLERMLTPRTEMD